MDGETSIDGVTWADAKTCGSGYGLRPKNLVKLADQGLIRALRIPGTRTRYAVEDVRKLAESSIVGGRSKLA